MKHAQIYSRVIWIILIGALTFGAIFAQSSNGDARKQFRRDARQLTIEIKAGENGAYLSRSKFDSARGNLNFELRKFSWTKLSELEKLEIASDWWLKWRAIRGAAEMGILSLQNSGAEEIVCIMERCYVPACEL